MMQLFSPCPGNWALMRALVMVLKAILFGLRPKGRKPYRLKSSFRFETGLVHVFLHLYERFIAIIRELVRFCLFISISGLPHLLKIMMEFYSIFGRIVANSRHFPYPRLSAYKYTLFPKSLLSLFCSGVGRKKGLRVLCNAGADPEGVQRVCSNPPFVPSYFIFMGIF